MKKTLLEQFIFLRQFCFSENIQSLFEAIKRNPDRVLVEEDQFHPLGCGMPSKKVYSHPLRYARNWNVYKGSTNDRYYMPSEVMVSKKINNLDTAANRFLKFALERFNDICESLINSLNQNGAPKQTECRREAKLIHGMINDMSYPKKIVHSSIEGEHLSGRERFRYKKVVILMGVNATGKTALAMTAKYIENHFDEIISHESEVEARLVEADCTIVGLTADNKSYIESFQNAGEHVVIIDGNYEETIEALLI